MLSRLSFHLHRSVAHAAGGTLPHMSLCRVFPPSCGNGASRERLRALAGGAGQWHSGRAARARSRPSPGARAFDARSAAALNQQQYAYWCRNIDVVYSLPHIDVWDIHHHIQPTQTRSRAHQSPLVALYMGISWRYNEYNYTHLQQYIT